MTELEGHLERRCERNKDVAEDTRDRSGRSLVEEDCDREDESKVEKWKIGMRN